MDSDKSEFAQISVYITIHTDICQMSLSIEKVDQIGKFEARYECFCTYNKLNKT